MDHMVEENPDVVNELSNIHQQYTDLVNETPEDKKMWLDKSFYFGVYVKPRDVIQAGPNTIVKLLQKQSNVVEDSFELEFKSDKKAVPVRFAIPEVYR